MGKMFCPDCEAWRHVAEVGSGEVIDFLSRNNR